jgi:hypothetical protein
MPQVVQYPEKHGKKLAGHRCEVNNALGNVVNKKKGYRMHSAVS